MIIYDYSTSKFTVSTYITACFAHHAYHLVLLLNFLNKNQNRGRIFIVFVICMTNNYL